MRPGGRMLPPTRTARSWTARSLRVPGRCHNSPGLAVTLLTPEAVRRRAGAGPGWRSMTPWPSGRSAVTRTLLRGAAGCPPCSRRASRCRFTPVSEVNRPLDAARAGRPSGPLTGGRRERPGPSRVEARSPASGAGVAGAPRASAGARRSGASRRSPRRRSRAAARRAGRSARCDLVAVAPAPRHAHLVGLDPVPAQLARDAPARRRAGRRRAAAVERRAHCWPERGDEPARRGATPKPATRSASGWRVARRARRSRLALAVPGDRVDERVLVVRGLPAQLALGLRRAERPPQRAGADLGDA